MRTLINSALLLLLGVSLAAAQLALPERVAEQYAVHVETTLAGAGYAVTVQAPSASVKSATLAMFVGATAYCEEACTLTAELDGTAATATAATPVPVAGNRRAPAMLAFTASNSSGGDAVEKASTPGGDVPAIINLDGVTIPSGALNTSNLTLRLSSITGDVRLTVIWREYP